MVDIHMDVVLKEESGVGKYVRVANLRSSGHRECNPARANIANLVKHRITR
jgi:hypothetical protein